MKQITGDVIYFIYGAGLIKIGRTVQIQSRLVALQTGSPAKLELIGVIPCDNSNLVEKNIHSKFNYLLSHGEWHYINLDLLKYIKEESIILNEKYLNYWFMRLKGPMTNEYIVSEIKYL